MMDCIKDGLDEEDCEGKFIMYILVSINQFSLQRLCDVLKQKFLRTCGNIASIF